MFKTGYYDLDIKENYVLSEDNIIMEEEKKIETNDSSYEEDDNHTTELPKTVIIDNGSGTIKAGLINDAPSVVIPSVVGRGRNSHTSHLYCIGDEAMSKRCILKLNHPINRGYIDNWDEMERIWQHIICHELRINIDEECQLLMTETVLNHKTNREKMSQIAFETLNMNCFYLCIDGILSLYSSGNVTGLICHSGYGSTYSLPIFEGYPLSHAINTLNISGKDINKHLCDALTKRGYEFLDQSYFYIADDIKKELCYIALNIQNEIESVTEKKYELPDGNQINIQKERIRCPEILFKPYFIGNEQKGIHELLNQSVIKSDIDIHELLYNKIVLCGGTTMFDGFKKRIFREIERLSNKEYKINVSEPTHKTYSTWMGGSILTSLDSFQEMWITKHEYDECGPTIIHRHLGY